MKWVPVVTLLLTISSYSGAEELSSLIQANSIAREHLGQARKAAEKSHEDALAVAYQRLFGLYDQRRENQHTLEGAKLELSKRVKEFRLDVESFRHSGGVFKPSPDGLSDDQLAQMTLEHRRSLHESASDQELYVFIATFKDGVTNYCSSEGRIYESAKDIASINQKAADIEAAIAETQEVIRALSKN